jgi:hypothetical protein
MEFPTRGGRIPTLLTVKRPVVGCIVRIDREV